jgi:hypothetical protein
VRIDACLKVGISLLDVSFYCTEADEWHNWGGQGMNRV